MKLSNIPFKLERYAFNAYYGACKSKPPSFPYLSGDGYRSICSQFYEKGLEETFDARGVRPYDLVFCESWRLKDFLSGPALSIRVPFSIISHNGDPNIEESYIPLLPPKLLRLFGQNVLAREPRLVPLPIGIENRRLHSNGIVRDFRKLRKRQVEKKPRILSAFTIGTNETIRRPALEQLSSSPLNDKLARVNARAYRKLAVQYMFIASPPGNGVDCHRTWEAMYLRSVPIVLRSSLTNFFADLGLPMCVVGSYEEVAAWDESTLVAMYERLSPGFENEALWFGYWERKIRAEASGEA